MPYTFLFVSVLKIYPNSMPTVYLHHILIHFLEGTVLTWMSGQLFSYVHVPSSDFLLVSREGRGSGHWVSQTDHTPSARGNSELVLQPKGRRRHWKYRDKVKMAPFAAGEPSMTEFQTGHVWRCCSPSYIHSHLRWNLTLFSHYPLWSTDIVPAPLDGQPWWSSWLH